MNHESVVLLMFLSMMMAGMGIAQEDYSTDVVKGLLLTPEGFSVGVQEKQLNRLGDRLAIAIIKIHTREELLRPENARRFLPLLSKAFELPKLITRPLDRKPKVTLVLLEWLAKEADDPDLRLEAAALAARLRPNN